MASFIFRWGAFINPISDEDEAWYHTFASVLLRGGQAYTDVVDLKPPLIYGWYAAVMSISKSMYFVHLVTAVWVFATAWVLRATVRWSFAPSSDLNESGAVPNCGDRGSCVSTNDIERASWMAAFVYVAFSATLWPNAVATNGEILMNLPVALAALFVMRFRAGAGLWNLFASGIMIATAALFKYQAGLVAPILLGFVLTSNSDGRRFWRRFSILCSTFAAGVACASAIVLIVTWLVCRVEDVLFWAWTYNFTFMKEFSWPYFFGNLASAAPQVIAAWLPLWILAYVCMIWVWRKRSWRSPEAFALAALVLACFGVATGGKFFAHYFLQLLPFLAMIVGYACSGPPPSLASKRLRIAGLAILPLVLSMVYGVLEARHDTRENDTARRLAVEVVARSHSQEPIFIWGRFPEIYYFADRTPASRFFCVSFVVGMNSYNYELPANADQITTAWNRFKAQLLSDLKQRPPAVIIDTSAAGFRQFHKYPLTDFDEIKDYLQSQHFTLSAVLDGFKFYTRN